jgi:hypothetical protein
MSLTFPGRPALAAVAALSLLAAAPVEAQLQSSGPSAGSPLPAVFLDCQVRINCDFDHFRTHIDFVVWVRDRADADVHVLLTSSGLSNGGRSYSLDYVGRGALEGLDDVISYTSSGDDSRAREVDGLTHALRLGLVRYAVQSGTASDLEISYTGTRFDPEEFGDGELPPAVTPAAPYDPWNYWTFRFGLSGNMDLRETRTNSRVNPTLSANRTTADWKMNFSGWANLRRDSRTLSDGREIRNDQNSWRLNALVVRSISDHMSVGIDAGGGNSVAGNQRARLQLAPAIEYNYFPYVQATRRQFIAHYAIGMEHSNYEEETVFELTRETVPQHRLGVQYRAREEWGNAGVGFESAQYLHDRSLHSFGFSGDLNYRIARGLELNVSGEAAFVNDNIHVPLQQIPDEEILLGRRSLPSSYQYQGSIGFNYRWGSSFASIVNNRFPPSVRQE